jgi:hypothetical protein
VSYRSYLRISVISENVGSGHSKNFVIESAACSLPLRELFKFSGRDGICKSRKNGHREKSEMHDGSDCSRTIFLDQTGHEMKLC